MNNEMRLDLSKKKGAKNIAQNTITKTRVQMSMNISFIWSEGSMKFDE